MRSSPFVKLQPGFIIVVSLLAACGWSLHPFAVLFGDVGHGRVVFTVLFTTLLLVLLAVHELGHAFAGIAHGHRITKIRVGLRLGVTAAGEHTDRSIRTIAAAGPLIGTAAALVALGLSPTWSVLWLAAVVALAENVANVLLFFVPGSDGSKIVSGTRCLAEPDAAA